MELKTNVFQKLEGYQSPLTSDSSIKPSVKQDSTSGNELKGSDLLLKRIEDEGFKLDEIKPILLENGNQMIVSCAGSGKTTSLVFLIQHDLVTGLSTKVVKVDDEYSMRVPDNILVSTFSREGTQEIKNRLREWQTHWGYNVSADTITFKTLHAEFKNALQAMGIPVKIDNTSYVKDACKKFGVINESTGRLSKDDYKTIEGIITYARNRLDNKRYCHQDMDKYNLTPAILDGIIDYCKQTRRNLGVVDYEDCQEILYGALKVNPKLSDFLASRYSYFYIDEFQDTSQVQYEVLKHYMKNAKKVVVVGDDDQAIYDWRGSDIDIMLHRFEQDFKPSVHYLGTNFRCPNNILDPVIPCIARNQNRFKKDIKAFNEGGVFDIGIYKTLIEGAQGLIDKVKEDVKNGNNVAILCRDNYDGLVPALLMQVDNTLNFRITSDLMTLKTPVAKSMLDVIGLFLDRNSYRVKKVLKMMVNKNEEYLVEQLCNVLRDNAKYSIWNLPDRDIKFSLPDLAREIARIKDIRTQSGDIQALIYTYWFIRNFAFSSNTPYCEGVRSVIDAIIYILDTKEFKYIEDFDNYMKELNEKISAHISANKNLKVEITTIHQAKGREWDSVYLWKTCQDTIPSYLAEDDIEPERKLFYIAVTRAKKKFTAITTTNNISEFLYECKLPSTMFVQQVSGSLKNKSTEEDKFDGIETSD